MDILVARTQDDIKLAFGRLTTADVIGCDTETSGLSARTGRLFSVQFSDGEFNVLVPVSEGVELGLLADLLNDPTTIKIFHNAKFDLDFLGENGYQVALKIVRENREVIDRLVDLLVERETIDGDELRQIVAEYAIVPEKEQVMARI